MLFSFGHLFHLFYAWFGFYLSTMCNLPLSPSKRSSAFQFARACTWKTVWTLDLSTFSRSLIFYMWMWYVFTHTHNSFQKDFPWFIFPLTFNNICAYSKLFLFIGILMIYTHTTQSVTHRKGKKNERREKFERTAIE